MPSLTTVRLAYLMPLLVYNYVGELHHPHTTQIKISGSGTYTNIPNPCGSHIQFSLLCQAAVTQNMNCLWLWSIICVGVDVTVCRYHNLYMQQLELFINKMLCLSIDRVCDVLTETLIQDLLLMAGILGRLQCILKSATNLQFICGKLFGAIMLYMLLSHHMSWEESGFAGAIKGVGRQIRINQD